MKNIILAVTVTLAIFASSDIFARGFSVGVLGSYAIDNGVIDDAMDQTAMPLIGLPSDVEYKSPILGGGVFFIEYAFKNNLFLRTGFESFFTISSGEIKGNSMGDEEYYFDYNAYAIPVFAGIRLSPDRGRTSVYGAAGIIYANVSIEREAYINTGGPIFDDTADSDSDFIGIGGLLGLERKVIFNTFLVIEYAFYKGSDARKEDAYDSSSFATYNYFERYSLPTQQLRVGLKYDF